MGEENAETYGRASMQHASLLSLSSESSVTAVDFSQSWAWGVRILQLCRAFSLMVSFPRNWLASSYLNGQTVHY